MGWDHFLAGLGEGSRLTESRPLTAGHTGNLSSGGVWPRGRNGGRRLLPSLARKVSQNVCLFDRRTSQKFVCLAGEFSQRISSLSDQFTEWHFLCLVREEFHVKKLLSCDHCSKVP